MKSYTVFLADDGIEKVINLKVSGEKHVIWARALKNWRLPTQFIIFLYFLGKNILGRFRYTS